MEWFNPPRRWSFEDDRLECVTDEKTDFWRETFFGWTTNNGHCYLERVTGDFTAEVSFGAHYRSHYDQAGLMLRVSDSVWLKAGAEFVHGAATLSSVVTRGQSDWATGPGVAIDDEIRLRITRKGGAVCVQWAPAGSQVPFQTLRLGFLADEPEVQVGPFACSPTSAGLEAHFTGFKVLAPIDFAGEV